MEQNLIPVLSTDKGKTIGSFLDLPQQTKQVSEEDILAMLNQRVTDLGIVKDIQSASKYKDDPELSPEQNAKRREYFLRMEKELSKEKKPYKSLSQKEKDRKKAKAASKARAKNRK